MKIVLVLISSLFLVNCATFRDFDPKKKVDLVEQPLGTVYSQEGQMLNRQSMVKDFRERKETADAIKGHEMLGLISIIIAGYGGWELGAGLGGDDNSRLTTGLLLAGTGIGLGYYTDQKLKSAVEIHNKGFKASNNKSTPLLVNFKFEF